MSLSKVDIFEGVYQFQKFDDEGRGGQNNKKQNFLKFQNSHDVSFESVLKKKERKLPSLFYEKDKSVE